MKNKRITCADERMITLSDPAAKPGKDLAKVDGVAYSGGTFRQVWDHRDMAVDLAGMELRSQIPLLLSHMNWPDCRLGVVTAVNDGKQLAVSGGIDLSDEQGRDIVEKGKKYDWQLSIGADVIEAVDVPDGEERTVNGRVLKGPILLVTKSKLCEVSVVAVGADSDTHLRIAASFQNKNSNLHPTQTKGVTMKKELVEFIRAKYSLGAECDEAAIRAHLAKIGTTVEAMQSEMDAKNKPQVAAKADPVKPAQEPAIQAAAPSGMTSEMIEAAANAAAERAIAAARVAETSRIEAINGITVEYPEIRDRAIAAGWTKERTEDVISGVKSVAAKLPSATGNIIVRNGPAVDAKAIEAALCLQCGIAENTIIASCGQQAMDIADGHLRGLGLKDVLVEAARIDGKAVGVGFSNETIRAAFSTVSLPGILSHVANKRALQAFTAQESIAEKLCSVGDLADFKEAERYRITDIGDLEIVQDGGELKDGSFGEDKATNKLTTYGKTFTLTREMIYNDDLGEFLKIPTAMGARAKQKIDQVFFTRLLANPTQGDGKALFSADHGNYKGGTTTALGVDALEEAISLFLDQVDSDGQPIAVEPKYLLVPTVLFPMAQRLCKSAVLLASGETDSTIPASNIIADYGLIPVKSPYLANAKYSGNSKTGWYLFGEPSQVDTFEIGYFQGRRVPTVEKGETNFNTLGMAFRVYFDFGVREQDHRGMTFFKGKQ